MARHTTRHAIFELSTLPGNPQVVVTHSFFVRPEYRCQGGEKWPNRNRTLCFKAWGMITPFAPFGRTIRLRNLFYPQRDGGS